MKTTIIPSNQLVQIDPAVLQENQGGIPVKVLIVEDSPLIRKYWPSRFAEEGFIAFTAADGAEGLNVFRAEGDIPVVITDYQMKGMDGSEMSRKIKEINPNAIVILMPGSSRLADRYQEVGEDPKQLDPNIDYYFNKGEKNLLRDHIIPLIKRITKQTN